MSKQGSVPPGHFFLPGPTEVRPEVSEPQTRQMIGHRGKAIRELIAELQEGLKVVFLTERPVVISTSSATGLMEAAVRNGVAGGRVLSLVTGAFSERFAEISVACGHDTEIWEVEWGQVHDVGEVAQRLERERFDALTLSQSETSTGSIHDLKALSAVLAGHPDTMLLVDSVTGVGGAEVRTDDWGLDFVVTGSQKALALPPGLAFGVASEAMMERSEKADHKGYYFDLIPVHESLAKFETPATPAVSLLYSLQAQLGRIAAEGMEKRWARHADMQRRTIDWVIGLKDRGVDVDVFAAEGHRSPTVTCVSVPGGSGASAIAAEMLERGWVIGAGYGKLKESTIRIGHMGDHTLDELNELLEVLEDVLT